MSSKNVFLLISALFNKAQEKRRKRKEEKLVSLLECDHLWLVDVDKFATIDNEKKFCVKCGLYIDYGQGICVDCHGIVNCLDDIFLSKLKSGVALSRVYNQRVSLDLSTCFHIRDRILMKNPDIDDDILVSYFLAACHNIETRGTETERKNRAKRLGIDHRHLKISCN
ncbi:MAG: hypothetical protein PHD02_04225 [Bacilli bacterium]|nr:hypothetical protein [Bacilli bacterium]